MPEGYLVAAFRQSCPDIFLADRVLSLKRTRSPREQLQTYDKDSQECWYRSRD